MGGSRIRAALGTLRKNEDGATIIEFALVAPVFLLMLFGTLEFGHTIYVQAVLQGAVQNAGRDAGLETGAENLASINSKVLRQVRNVAPKGAIVTSRRNYQSFADVDKPEDFTDANGNNIYDPDECFVDLNGNGRWDADRSQGGQGGADDVVVYTATLEYDRITPFWKLIGWDKKMTLTGTTILRNQPFADQAVRRETLICPS